MGPRTHNDAFKVFNRVSKYPRWSAFTSTFGSRDNPTFKIIELLSAAGEMDELLLLRKISQNPHLSKEQYLDELHNSFQNIYQKYTGEHQAKHREPLDRFLKAFKKQIHRISKEVGALERIINLERPQWQHKKNKETDTTQNYSKYVILDKNNNLYRNSEKEDKDVKKRLKWIRFRGRRIIPIPFFGTITDFIALSRLGGKITKLEKKRENIIKDLGFRNTLSRTATNQELEIDLQILTHRIKNLRRKQKEIINSTALRFVMSVATSESFVAFNLGAFGLTGPVGYAVAAVFACATAIVTFYLLRKAMNGSLRMMIIEGLFTDHKGREFSPGKKAFAVFAAVSAAFCAVGAFLPALASAHYVLALLFSSSFPPALIITIAIIMSVNTAFAFTSLFTNEIMDFIKGEPMKAVKNFLFENFVKPFRDHPGFTGFAIAAFNVFKILLVTTLIISIYITASWFMRERALYAAKNVFYLGSKIAEKVSFIVFLAVKILASPVDLSFYISSAVRLIFKIIPDNFKKFINALKNGDDYNKLDFYKKPYKNKNIILTDKDNQALNSFVKFRSSGTHLARIKKAFIVLVGRVPSAVSSFQNGGFGPKELKHTLRYPAGVAHTSQDISQNADAIFESTSNVPVLARMFSFPKSRDALSNRPAASAAAPKAAG